MTLPILTIDAVIGKFLAAWCFTGVALALTFPIWITVNYLGEPDNTVILASYIGSFMMAAGFLAIGSCISALIQKPGHCIRHHPCDLFSVYSLWLSCCPGLCSRVGAAMVGGCHCIFQFSDAF